MLLMGTEKANVKLNFTEKIRLRNCQTQTIAVEVFVCKSCVRADARRYN